MKAFALSAHYVVKNSRKIMTPYQVNVAGESFAVTTFSQAGYDVSIQYGTTQPEWDFIAMRDARTLRVSVKGSQDGARGLFQSHIADANYHAAVDAWLDKQAEGIVYMLIQFENIPVGNIPRAYLAWPREIAEHMHTTRAGHAQTKLYEDYTYSKGVGAGHRDLIPANWKATQNRIDGI